ncbi:MAG: hypothetical protein A2312_01145 [Candidatus Staskawiczbacteria bacterium RIFOXYB2_FULL_32_9]|uniref:Transcriptional repressor n=1 Tax=Candidatus Staskawiczbacteria bacterium RIFOXYD1_FULL_32_13 TaxID=1802234 RepID=A0A1G2JN45_9BACT|nr:MAG: Transcriptional regulator, Fur family [Parcubacteria group bacterium GW2011_GWC2_32_10]OGZ78957.1 MAG: hypothetical protein A2256_02760 [Candidatus Staskawiczbacteria bacterium RIFOXYA2_FULL_32_7]OGZ80428.1 MAG: hypothetical protein A2360_00990 [Candidatus Staskawiczbacteria bacterium RIFOXYB1_FULL_32_11]OGZ81322.1 MAG: hypothetical protein A2312_01145 [Candidatus Staskawiczbacteria bacterium RIFOXYB2_FULL_32_9]OGZ87646.1 MAG: hypothetical protein A2463_01400 [Candidatus Staskawiczbacte
MIITNKKTHDTTHKTIQLFGGRLTKIRKAVISSLGEGCCLLTKEELIKKLKNKKINPDRSTIYRELQFLTKNHIILKNTISGKDYYEIPKDHHHHLICLKCSLIIKVDITNHLKKQEKQIAKQNQFNIINHSLEFYGYCHACGQAR